MCLLSLHHFLLNHILNVDYFFKIYMNFTVNGMLLEISSLMYSVKCQKRFFQETFCCK